MFFSTNTKSRLVSDFLKGSGRAQRKLKKPFKFETMTKSKELPKGTKGFDSAGKSVIIKSKETVLVATDNRGIKLDAKNFRCMYEHSSGRSLSVSLDIFKDTPHIWNRIFFLKYSICTQKSKNWN